MDKNELKIYVDSKIEELKTLKESDKDQVVEILKTVLWNYNKLHPDKTHSKLKTDLINGIKRITTETVLNEINELNKNNLIYIGYNYLMIRGTLGGITSLLEKL
jgi:hypothetical protein